MMGDPPRLRTGASGLEAALLRSSRDLEPPPAAEEEVWRRVQMMTAAGVVAGSTGLAASTAAAGSKVAAKTLWLSLLKWGAVVAVAVPAAGVATRWAVHREAHSSAALVGATFVAQRVGTSEARPEVASPPGIDAQAAVAATPIVKAGPSAPVRSRGAAFVATNGAKDGRSALDRESLALGLARAKFASGDPRGALAEVSRLGVEFPHGGLIQEREVLAIDCLKALGDAEGTRSRASVFVDRFPQSPYLTHVRPLALP
jgi:hypothetical protein